MLPEITIHLPFWSRKIWIKSPLSISFRNSSKSILLSSSLVATILANPQMLIICTSTNHSTADAALGKYPFAWAFLRLLQYYYPSITNLLSGSILRRDRRIGLKPELHKYICRIHLSVSDYNGFPCLKTFNLYI